jgi:hypothetical protein
MSIFDAIRFSVIQEIVKLSNNTLSVKELQRLDLVKLTAFHRKLKGKEKTK